MVLFRFFCAESWIAPSLPSLDGASRFGAIHPCAHEVLLRFSALRVLAKIVFSPL
jgi:hypothetical protein